MVISKLLIFIAVFVMSSISYATVRCETMAGDGAYMGAEDQEAVAPAPAPIQVLPAGQTLLGINIRTAPEIERVYTNTNSPEFRSAVSQILWMMYYAKQLPDLSKEVDEKRKLDLGIPLPGAMSLQLHYEGDRRPNQREDNQALRLKNVVLITESGREIKLLDPAVTDDASALLQSSLTWTGTVRGQRDQDGRFIDDAELSVNNVSVLTPEQIRTALKDTGIPEAEITAALQHLPKNGTPTHPLGALESIRGRLASNPVRTMILARGGTPVAIPRLIQGQVLERIISWSRWFGEMSSLHRDSILRDIQESDARMILARAIYYRGHNVVTSFFSGKVFQKMLWYGVLGVGLFSYNMANAPAPVVMTPSQQYEQIAQQFLRSLTSDEQTSFRQALQALEPAEAMSQPLAARLFVPRVSNQPHNDRADYLDYVTALGAAEQRKAGTIRNYVANASLGQIREVGINSTPFEMATTVDLQFFISEYDKTNVITLSMVTQRQGQQPSIATVDIRRRDDPQLFEALTSRLSAAREAAAQAAAAAARAALAAPVVTAPPVEPIPVMRNGVPGVNITEEAPPIPETPPPR